MCLAGPAPKPLLPFISLMLLNMLKVNYLRDIITLIQAALDLMFVCLERMGARCVSLIGLTSDAVCVWLYYTGCVVILNLEPEPSPSAATVPPLTPPWRPALSTRHLSAPRATLSHAHTYASTHTSKQSYPMCLHSDGMPEETLHPLPQCLSLLFSPNSGGVILDGELNQLN